MLTMPILLGSWTIASTCALITGLSILRKQYWLAVAFYWLTGFFGLAVPLKVAMSATSIFAMVLLGAIWPVWLLQEPLDFSLLSPLPEWFKAMLFSF